MTGASQRIFSDIPAYAGVILLRSDIFANAKVVLYSLENWVKPNNTCEANITGGANRTRRKANITEKVLMHCIRTFSWLPLLDSNQRPAD